MNDKIPGRSISSLVALGGAVTLLLGACQRDDARAADLPPAAPAERSAAAAEPALPSDTIDLRRIGYSLGRDDAPVTVIEFSDFGCPYCASFSQSTFPELHREFVESGRVRWVYVPFVMGMFPNGDGAARAAECAAEQGRFWQMKERVYAGQREWRSSRDAEPLFRGYAGEVGLDGERFASCYREDRGGARTRTNNRAADALGIRATPTFVVNGRLVEGALPAEQFRMVLARLAGGEE